MKVLAKICNQILMANYTKNVCSLSVAEFVIFAIFAILAKRLFAVAGKVPCYLCDICEICAFQLPLFDSVKISGKDFF